MKTDIIINLLNSKLYKDQINIIKPSKEENTIKITFKDSKNCKQGSLKLLESWIERDLKYLSKLKSDDSLFCHLLNFCNRIITNINIVKN